jgi:hypothetical protein
MDFITTMFKDKINILGLLMGLLGAYMLMPNFFDANIFSLPLSQDLWMSLDPSWGIALNYVELKNLTWGTEVAFTYGPLAHLCTRVGWGENRFSFLFFDLFMYINYFFLFFISFKESRNKIITALTIIAVCLIFPLWFGSAHALILMAILVFWIRLSLDQPKLLYYVFQILIITLLFFIKFNTGLIAFPLFFAGIFCNLINKNGNKIHLIAYLIGPIILILALAIPLNVALFPYIKSGFEMVSGYNDIMFLENQIAGSYSYCIAMAIILTAILFINIYSNQKKDWIKILTILFLFGTSIFVLYKQAFVRADLGHIREFFIYIPIIILCNLDLHQYFKSNILKVAFVIALSIPFYFLIVNQKGSIDIKAKFPKSEYFSRFNSFPTKTELFLSPSKSQLPTSVLEKIGANSVDVYPWNIQLLLENKLNYKPRPVLQSYTVYTPYLEQMDFDFYNSSKAPEFVIYDFAAIDGRYPLFDESKMNLALIKNYKVAEMYEFDGRKGLLLQKKSDFKPLKLEKIKEYAMLLNTPLVPKKDIYYEIGIYNNLLGKVVSLFQHAPEIRLEIKLKDGNKMDYRTSKLLLETGIFSDKFIYETKNFKTYLDPLNDNQEIKYYNFKPLNLSLFKDKIRITEYKIIQ